MVLHRRRRHGRPRVPDARGGATRCAPRRDVRAWSSSAPRAGIEARVVPERGDELELLDVAADQGRRRRWRRARRRARGASTLPRRARSCGGSTPARCSRVGGYAAGPVALAARSLRRAARDPRAEQRARPREPLLAPFARRAYVALPETSASSAREHGACAPASRSAALRAAPVRGRRAERSASSSSAAARARRRSTRRARARSPRSRSRRRRSRSCIRRAAIARPRCAGSTQQLGARRAASVVPFIDDVADRARARPISSSLARAAAASPSSARSGAPRSWSRSRIAADDHQRKNAQSLERRGRGGLPRARASRRRARDRSRWPRA